MGYGTTAVMILFGLSVAFYFYAEWVSDPVTEMYSNASSGKISNISAQSEAMNSQLQAMGMAARGNFTSNLFLNAITGSFTGLLAGAVASLVSGGGFAMVYILPAVALGGIIGMITAPLDMVNSMLIGAPPEIGFVFFTFIGLLLFVFAIAFVRGDM